jgi:RNase P/RNase MRP subunit POP5
MNNPNNKPKKGNQAIRLKPSMRDKERYVAFEMISKESLPGNADRLLVAEVKALLGVFQSAKAKVTPMKYNPEKQRGIIRVERKYQDTLKSCFVMINNLNKQNVLIRTIRISGMISKLKELIY